MSAQSPPGAESTLAHAGPNAWGEEEGDAWLEGASEKARQVGARVRRSDVVDTPVPNPFACPSLALARSSPNISLASNP